MWRLAARLHRAPGPDLLYSLAVMWATHVVSGVTLPAQKWEAAFASSGHGGFFTPCKYLKERAAAGVELCSTEERSKL
jgi:hypothetical protein